MFCENEQWVERGHWNDLTWLGLHCTMLDRESCLLIYFALKHNALKHCNWLQPRRKLYHCHKDSTGCRMLLSAGSENNVTTFQWPARSCCLPSNCSWVFFRKTFSRLPEAAVTLHTQNCMAQSVLEKVGLTFRVMPGRDYLDFLKQDEPLWLHFPFFIDDRVVLNESIKWESSAS